jgi:hypothetical protein
MTVWHDFCAFDVTLVAVPEQVPLDPGDRAGLVRGGAPGGGAGDERVLRVEEAADGGAQREGGGGRAPGGQDPAGAGQPLHRQVRGELPGGPGDHHHHGVLRGGGPGLPHKAARGAGAVLPRGVRHQLVHPDRPGAALPAPQAHPAPRHQGQQHLPDHARLREDRGLRGQQGAGGDQGAGQHGDRHALLHEPRDHLGPGLRPEERRVGPGLRPLRDVHPQARLRCQKRVHVRPLQEHLRGQVRGHQRRDLLQGAERAGEVAC